MVKIRVKIHRPRQIKTVLFQIIPRDVRQLKQMVRLSLEADGPMAIRYARDGDDMGANLRDACPMRIGTWEELISGDDVMILAVGRMVQTAMRVAIDLMGVGISCGVTDARFIKPMDEELLKNAAENHRLIVTLEDNVLAGGFGSGVAEWLCDHGYTTALLRIGVPDRFIEYGVTEEQMAECGMDAQSIRNAIINRMTKL